MKWQALHPPWQESSRQPAPEVRWSLRDGFLFWEFRGPRPIADRTTFAAAADGFTEGLWTGDVAECFLGDEASKEYTEFNLGPGGGWWACAHTAPRIRARQQPDWTGSGIRSGVCWTATHWRGWMRCPVPFPVSKRKPLDAVRLNFTAVIDSGSAREYYSLARLPGLTPDFHQPDQWLLLHRVAES